MTPLMRHAFNVNASEIGDFAHCRATLRKWQSTSVLCMGDKQAPNLQARMLCDDVRSWGGFGIYRPFEMSEGALWRERSPKDQVNWLQSFGQPQWWYNVGNEPLPGGEEIERMDRWYEEFIDRAVQANLKVVVPSFGTGAYQLEHINSGAHDRMLRKIGEYANERVDGYNRVMLGVHTYAHALIPWHTAGRNPADLTKPELISRDKWPTQAEIFDGDESDNWLVIRENWWVNRIQTLMGKPTRVDVALAECFLDRMPNIEIQFRDVTAKIDSLAGQRTYGIPTLWNYWRAMFPLWTPERTLVEQMKWCEEVYPTRDDAYPGDYVAFCWFTWSRNSQWHDHYDPSDNVAWLDLVAEQVRMPQPPPVIEPTPPVVPAPKPEPPPVIVPEPPTDTEDTTEMPKLPTLAELETDRDILKAAADSIIAAQKALDAAAQLIMPRLLKLENEIEDRKAA